MNSLELRSQPKVCAIAVSGIGASDLISDAPTIRPAVASGEQFHCSFVISTTSLQAAGAVSARLQWLPADADIPTCAPIGMTFADLAAIGAAGAKFIGTQLQRLTKPSPMSTRKLVAAATKNQRSTMSMAPAPTQRSSERNLASRSWWLSISNVGLILSGDGGSARRTAAASASVKSFDRFMPQPYLPCPRQVSQLCARAATIAGSWPDELLNDWKAGKAWAWRTPGGRSRDWRLVHAARR